MKLTDAHRRQILRRSYPHLPLEPDEAKALEPGTITINQQVWVEIRGAKRDKKAGWFVDYVVFDYRPKFMRRGQGHTHAIQLAVAQEGEDVIPDDYQEKLTMEGRLRRVESQNAEDLALRQFKSFADAARGIVRRQARLGIDPGPTLARFMRELEDELDEQAAA